MTWGSTFTIAEYRRISKERPPRPDSPPPTTTFPSLSELLVVVHPDGMVDFKLPDHVRALARDHGFKLQVKCQGLVVANFTPTAEYSIPAGQVPRSTDWSARFVKLSPRLTGDVHICCVELLQSPLPDRELLQPPLPDREQLCLLSCTITSVLSVCTVFRADHALLPSIRAHTTLECSDEPFQTGVSDFVPAMPCFQRSYLTIIHPQFSLFPLCCSLLNLFPPENAVSSCYSSANRSRLLAFRAGNRCRTTTATPSDLCRPQTRRK
jgi:hypothetical protein